MPIPKFAMKQQHSRKKSPMITRPRGSLTIVNTAWVKVARGTREAQDERERTQKMREDALRTMATAMEEAERAQTAADEQRRKADAADVLAEKLEEEADRHLKECIQPVVTPSLEELVAAKR